MQTFYLTLVKILSSLDGRSKMVYFYLKMLDVRWQNISRSIVNVQLNVQNDVDVLNMKLFPLSSALVKETVTTYKNQIYYRM